MKKLVNLSLALVALVAVTSCGGDKSFGKMNNGFNQTNSVLVNHTCTPEVLVLNSGVVAAEVTVNFPANYFQSYVIVKVTPVIVFEGGEVAGEPFYYQGTEVADNYTVVSAAGGAFAKSLEFAYSDEMRLSELQLRFEMKNAKKAENQFYVVDANTGNLLSAEEDAIVASGAAEAEAILAACGAVVAQGINTLQSDFDFAALMDDMANDYQAVTYEVSKADISYTISSSRVNNSSLNSAQMESFKESVKATEENSYASQTISANGYASPDGPEKFNDKLSSARSESAKKALNKFFAEMGLEADAAAYGEDWDGFKELVAASSIQDKNLILQVLSLYDSSVQREAEIKNLSAVYSELKNDILPILRRSQIVSNISINGLSNDEMMALVAAREYAELTVEELLFLAESVITEDEVKLDVLEYAAKKFSDARAYNNMGTLLSKMGQAEAALDAFEMSTRNGASDATINKNLVLSNLDNNNFSEAKKYSADAVAGYALSAMEGNYTPAATNLKGYNAAVANVMVNNYAAAKSALAGDNSASADYLRGVIAAAEGNTSEGIEFIKKAVATAPEMAAKAEGDVNLANLFEAGLVF